MYPTWLPHDWRDWVELICHPIYSTRYYLEQLIHGQEITEHEDRPGPTVIESGVYGDLEARPVVRVLLRARSRRVDRRINGFLLANPPKSISFLNDFEPFIIGTTAIEARDALHSLANLERKIHKDHGRVM